MAKDPRETRIEDLPGPKNPGELEEMKMPYEEYCRKAFDPGNEWAKPEALKGIRWLSCTMYIFTPHSAANLAELGADVIKIEIPRMGDAMRHTSPFNEAYLYPLHDTRPMTGTGFGFLGANVNETYLSMDYHIPEMVDVFYRLLTRRGEARRGGRRLPIRAEGLRRLLRHPGPSPRGARLHYGDARVHGRARHQALQLVHRLGVRNSDLLRSPGSHPLEEEDGPGHHDRVLPGPDPDPVLRVYLPALRPVRHRPPAVGELGHPVMRPRDHPVRKVRFSRCAEPPGQARSPVRDGLGLQRPRLQGTLRHHRAEGFLREIQGAQGPGGCQAPGRNLRGSGEVGRRQDPDAGRKDPHECGHPGRPRDERPGGLRMRALPAEGDHPVAGRSPLRRQPAPERPQRGDDAQDPEENQLDLEAGGRR